MWSANEPMAVYPGRPAYKLRRKALPQMEHSQYFGLYGSDLEKFENYVRNLLAVRYKSLGGCRNCGFPVIARRVCLKVLNSPWMLDWYLDYTDAHVVFLMRHPASQALSVIRQKWDYAVKAYFNRPEELEKTFTDRQIRCGRDILRRGDIWEMAILDWTVGTHHGRMSARSDLIKVFWEDLVANPADFVETVLAGKLGLRDIERHLETIRKPSNSSYMSTQENLDYICKGDIDRLLTSWTAKINDGDKKRAQEILDIFGVTAYSMDNVLPRASWTADSNNPAGKSLADN